MDASVGQDQLMALDMVKLSTYNAFPVVILHSLINKSFERFSLDIGQDGIAVAVHFDFGNSTSRRRSDWDTAKFNRNVDFTFCRHGLKPN